jgi:metal-sulfur cluster biosynthetic enzyme
LEERIIEKLKTVYDPEFPLVDMYTLGLIYGIDLKIKNKICDVTMTFTTPTCPMADMIMELVKNAVLDVIPDWEVNIIISFEPMWEPSMIKDADLQKMFL